MFKSIRIRLAERAAKRAIGEALAYSKGRDWNLLMQSALTRRADIAVYRFDCLVNPNATIRSAWR